ncbi:MAG: glycoside hydrolase family 99-like domain-containing protein [Thermofilum sp.]|nr:glycoside hydrolase family 99-like domain-containing protein [Thermofilum sp.]
MHTSVQAVLDNFEYNLNNKYDEWLSLCIRAGEGFIPSAIPGFDDRSVTSGNLPLPRSLDRFKKQLEIAKLHAKDNIFIVTTFNEWHESTQIEPSREEGMKYLEVLLTSLNPRE